ncbi:MAG: hypothetical protein KAY32_10400 [Candidatus Eisenbacteria sp.]|nr:hypothetical protein [Candidatus Eisenbacteria bacterium]
MAHQAKVFVASKPFAGIVSVQYEQFTPPDDKNYRPADRSRNGLITIRRASDEDCDWFSWASESTEDKWRSGKVEFLDENDEKLRELVWDHGFVHQYKEGMPDRRVEDVARRIYEEIQIQAEIIEVDGERHEDNWPEV